MPKKATPRIQDVVLPELKALHDKCKKLKLPLLACVLVEGGVGHSAGIGKLGDHLELLAAMVMQISMESKCNVSEVLVSVHDLIKTAIEEGEK